MFQYCISRELLIATIFLFIIPILLDNFLIANYRNNDVTKRNKKTKGKITFVNLIDSYADKISAAYFLLEGKYLLTAANRRF